MEPPPPAKTILLYCMSIKGYVVNYFELILRLRRGQEKAKVLKLGERPPNHRRIYRSELATKDHNDSSLEKYLQRAIYLFIQLKEVSPELTLLAALSWRLRATNSRF